MAQENAMVKVRFITGIEPQKTARLPNISALRNKAQKSDRKLKHVFHTDLYDTDHELTGVEKKNAGEESAPKMSGKAVAAIAVGLVGSVLVLSKLRHLLRRW
jgi:hypothetical protein